MTKTNTDKIEKRPHYQIEKFPNKEEINKLVHSKPVKELDLEDHEDYIKELEERINNAN